MIIDFISNNVLNFNTKSIYDMCSQMAGDNVKISRISIEEKKQEFHTIIAYYFNEERETIHFTFTMDEYKRGLRNVKFKRILNDRYNINSEGF